jgi:HAD superfamily hydrolase (TIGR01549 family)
MGLICPGAGNDFPMTSSVIAVFDVDGTLVDTNYQHALAWYRAFRRLDIVLPIWRLHRAIGMGGDRLVAAVTDDEVERQHGSELRRAWAAEYEQLSGDVAAFDGAHELLAEVRDRGCQIALASSGQPDQIDRYVRLLDAGELIDARTSSDDVEQTKPAPDLLQVAIDRLGGGAAVMIGDSTWDAVAAGRINVPMIAVRNGGFSPEELRAAGAAAVYDSLSELRAALDRTPLGQPSAMPSRGGPAGGVHP